MSALGRLKGQKTIAYNQLVKTSTAVRDELDREAHLPTANLAEVERLNDFAGLNLPKLKRQLDRFETATDKLQEHLIEIDNDEELDRLQAEIDKNSSALETIGDFVFRLEHYHTKIKDRLLLLTPKPEAELAQPQQNQAELAQVIAEAVAQAIAQNMPQQQIAAQAAVQPVINPPPAQQQLRVKLPKFEIPKFSGDIMEWTGFWAQFTSAVHDVQAIQPIDKFQYLRSHLTGDAFQTISGYDFTPQNYPVVVAALQQRFGRNDLIIETHFNALYNIPTSSSDSVKLRSFYDQMERHLRTLETQHQPIDSMAILTILKTKLPQDVIKDMELSKPHYLVWTMPLFRQYLRQILELRESVSQSAKVSAQNSVSSSNQQDSTRFSGSGGRPRTNYVSPTSDRSGKPNQFRSSAHALIATERKNNRQPCIYCQKDHWSDECRTVPTTDARRTKLREQHRCFNCLRDDHQSFKQCKKTLSCYHCGNTGHHRSLCHKQFGSIKKPNTQKPDGKGGGSTKPHLLQDSKQSDQPSDDDTGDYSSLPVQKVEHNSLSLPGSPESALIASNESVIMQTATVAIQNTENSTQVEVPTIFDCGANSTYVTWDVVKALKLPLGKRVDLSVATFGHKVETFKVPTTVLAIKLKDGSIMNISAYVRPQISAPTHRVPYGKIFPSFLLNEYSMADTIPTQSELRSYHLLIGQDYYFDFLLQDRFEIRRGLYLQGSKLGWIIAGRIKDRGSKLPSPNLFVQSFLSRPSETSFLVVPDPQLPVAPDMQMFWDLETLGIEIPSTQSDEDIAVEQFNKTVHIKDKRFEVSWPWKVQNPELPSNYSLAYNRFKSVAKKFSANPELFKRYGDIIQKQITLGIIEPVTSSTFEGPLKHYVPHHPVETPSKVTTQTRVVYDASAKATKHSLSLNDCLYPGPILLQNLCGLLIRLRLWPLAIIADIEKAFLNIGLSPPDRDVTRFFWFKDPTNPTVTGNVQIYRFARIPFGVTSSPFLLASAVNYLLDLYSTPVSLQLRRDIYVDNVITGASDVKSALQIYHESQDIFNSVSLNLREWSSNSTEFIQQIPEHHRAEGCILKILGISWNTTTDCFHITGFDKAKFQFATTKREVLQAIASVFDPLGFFSPVSVVARIFLHSLWAENFNWDDKLPPDKLNTWKEIYDSLHLISSQSIPRFIGHSAQSGVTYQLLCFCDASAKIYATTVYLRITFDNVHTVHFLFSKTRLSPPDTSIPRCELLAAVIGVRSLNSVADWLHVLISAKMLWSDSQVVLHWIRNPNKKLKVFVENRINEIRKTEDITYRYVHTSSNPADIATRGCSVDELNQSIWWNGPTWLLQPEDTWPSWDVEKFDQATIDSIEAEARKTPSVMYEVGLRVGEGRSRSTKKNEEPVETPFDIDYNNYSSVNKLYRVTAYGLRFARNCLKRTLRLTSLSCQDDENLFFLKTLYLTSHEIAEAKLLWELSIRKHYFSDVLDSIKTGSKNNLRDQLGLFIDRSGLLRSRSRYANAVCSDTAREPKLLPSDDHFTQLIIESVHRTFLHSGVSQTLASIRQEYWILQGRSRVRLILSNCRVCRRCMGGSYKLPAMAPWPKEKMTQSPPFTVTGLDYFGPLYIKDDSVSSRKVWVCLFTCVAVRAVHLELIDDMTTEQFLMCFRRFIARYGKPHQLISDNATQFKLAKSTIDKVWDGILSDPDTVNYIANQGISWKFIVQFAPWTGGFYERMVGVVKSSLKKTIGKVCLTLYQLSTILAEVQAVVNSRPLVYVNDDIHSDMALSPAHFLTLNPHIGVPPVLPHSDEVDPDFNPLPVSSAQSLLVTWKKGQRQLDQFWTMWRNNYLLSLRERTQHHVVQGRIQSPSTPTPGDIVLIKDNLPRGSWKIGKVQSLISSQDGAIRAAIILLPNRKTLSRPINLLYPIECPDTAQTVSGTTAPVPDTVVDDVPATVNAIQPVVTNQRPTRAAAIRARDGIRRCVKDMVGLVFTNARR